MTTIQIISWFGAQILMIAFVLFAAWHHAPAVKAFREYVPQPNPYEDPFHFWAAGMAIVFTVALSLGLLSWHPLLSCIVFGKLAFCWYWLLFDITLNEETGKSWDYVRSHKGIDGWLTRKFGNNAGEYKAVAMVVSIVLINVLKFVL